jgi:spore coat protein JC
MWNYEKRLQHPVKIKQTNAELAKVIITQFGGPDGELAASMRYLSQRYDTPYRETAALLTDIGVSVPKLPLPFGNGFFIHKKRSAASGKHSSFLHLQQILFIAV